MDARASVQKRACTAGWACKVCAQKGIVHARSRACSRARERSHERVCKRVSEGRASARVHMR
eukprot:937325-Pleurochrysis_carterae.AAC.1